MDISDLNKKNFLPVRQSISCHVPDFLQRRKSNIFVSDGNLNFSPAAASTLLRVSSLSLMLRQYIQTHVSGRTWPIFLTVEGLSLANVENPTTTSGYDV